MMCSKETDKEEKDDEEQGGSGGDEKPSGDGTYDEAFPATDN